MPQYNHAFCNHSITKVPRLNKIQRFVHCNSMNPSSQLRLPLKLTLFVVNG